MREPRLRVGDDETYATVWEWELRGSNRDIGRTLASYGRDQLGVAPVPCPDANRIRAQRRFLERHFRPLYDRMVGVADAFDLSMDEPTHDLATLWFDVQIPGCSAGYVPAGPALKGETGMKKNKIKADSKKSSRCPVTGMPCLEYNAVKCKGHYCWLK